MSIRCDLMLYGGYPCSSKTDRHHMVSRARLLGNPKARKYVDSHPELIAEVCNIHNAETKLADTKRARALLFERKCQEYGTEHMRLVLDELRQLFKDGAPDLCLDAILLGL